MADGRRISGDALIGADGIHSPVREQMLGAEKPIFTGNIAWRAVVPMAALGAHAPRPTACAWMGPGKHCVTYRLRRGTLANFVGVVERDDWTTESWTERGTREEALADFADWHPPSPACWARPIRFIVGLCSTARHCRAGLMAALPSGRCGPSDVAFHGARRGHGGGRCLGCRARSDAKIEPARGLEAYQHLRQTRASRVQAGSRANAKTFHKRTRLGQLATYGPMWLAGKFAPMAVHKRQDPIYGHDVTRLDK